MPAPFHVERGTKTSRLAALFALAAVAGLALAPFWASRADIRLLGEFFSFLALASLWNLLAGYSGLVSVGQQAYVGLGGYLLFALCIFGGVHPLAAIALAGLGGALAAGLAAPLLFRLQGAYFAIGTWVLAEVFRLSFAQLGSLGGGSGTSLPARIVTGIASDRGLREAAIYWTGLALSLLALGFVILTLRSRLGLALTASRDSPIASESLGIDIWRTKLLVYVGAGALTAATGAFIFLQKLRITPDAAFSVNDWTAYVIFIAVIGGIGTVEGPILGTILFFALRETLAELGTIYLMILGATAILVMLRAPKGIWGTLAERFGWSLVPIRRRVVFTPD